MQLESSLLLKIPCSFPDEVVFLKTLTQDGFLCVCWKFFVPVILIGTLINPQKSTYRL
jgi:hypothetical protein